MRGLYKHIATGKIVLIDDGEYEYDGRVSNYYSGRVVGKNGKLTNKIFGDYDKRDTWKKIIKYEVKVTYSE